MRTRSPAAGARPVDHVAALDHAPLATLTTDGLAQKRGIPWGTPLVAGVCSWVWAAAEPAMRTAHRIADLKGRSRTECAERHPKGPRRGRVSTGALLTNGPTIAPPVRMCFFPYRSTPRGFTSIPNDYRGARPGLRGPDRHRGAGQSGSGEGEEPGRRRLPNRLPPARSSTPSAHHATASTARAGRATI